jgi:hypothetical protein
MEKSIEKFLEFNGKVIYFLAKDGKYWIAIKPICEALKINFSRQLRTIKADKTLKAEWSLQTMQVGNDQLRKYACLPEFFVYGWLFQIKSSSEELHKYKWECYRILFEHFHGKITSRETIISQKTKDELEYDKIIAEFRTTPAGQRAFELERKKRVYNSALKELDDEIKLNQLPLFS